MNYSTSSFNHNSLATLYNPSIAAQNTKNSSVNYSRNFPGTPFRISASIEATQTSADSMVTMSLPNIAISMNRMYPLQAQEACRGRALVREDQHQLLGAVPQ